MVVYAELAKPNLHLHVIYTFLQKDASAIVSTDMARQVRTWCAPTYTSLSLISSLLILIAAYLSVAYLIIAFLSVQCALLARYTAAYNSHRMSLH